MTNIYLVRHGQTAWNKEEIFRGRSDVPLNDTGLREAELAAEFFRGLEIRAIYSSPLLRASQTAGKIAAVLSLKVEPLEGIIDMSFGVWEGRPLREVEASDGERYLLWREEPHRLKLPGGESLDEVRERSMAVVETVIRKHAEEAVIMVTHRVINKVILCAILGLDNSHFWQLSQDTTAINLIRYRRGNFTLSLMNESCHLKPLLNQKVKVDF
jgi:broad specificity phosphatase PhoE